MPDPLRGEIWSADLGAGRGREQSGQRPVLVFSVDGFNRGPAELFMAIPPTSKVAKSRSIPLHIPVNPPEGGLRAPSVILCDQLRICLHRAEGNQNIVDMIPWLHCSVALLIASKDHPTHAPVLVVRGDDVPPAQERAIGPVVIPFVCLCVGARAERGGLLGAARPTTS